MSEPAIDPVLTMLTGPGGMFEVVTDDVGGVSMKVFKERMHSLREVAALAADRPSDQLYLVYGDRRITFADFIKGANGVGAQLVARHGLAPGDRVAVLSANNPEWVTTFWATVDLGAVLVGLNGWWKADEILYGLEDSGSRILVADRGRLERLKDGLAGLDLEAIYLIDGDPAEFDDPRVHSFSELEGSPIAEFPTTAIDEDDPAVIFYTSGTTGRPKGAISTHRSMIANLQNTVFGAVSRAMAGGGVPGGLGGDGKQSASLLTSPLFHVSGCHSGIVVGLMAGVKIVIPVGRFEPEEAMRLIAEEKIETWATVPTMVWRVVEHPGRHDYDLSSVTTIAYGGSPSAAELQRRVAETFPTVKGNVGNAYGLTESSSVATAIFGQDFIDRPDSVGKPVPVVDIRIVAEGGKVQGPGELGEVQIKGPIIMPGYWNKPEATAESIVDGWLKTGDIGYIDDEGFLFITDRAKDMIIRGGENVYCVEIENRLIEHPKIAEAAVIGVPHQTLGEEVKAVVRGEEGETITEDEVRQWVGETLAGFKVPAYVEFVTERLPRNPSGKLLKNVLRGEGEVSFAETL